MDSILADLEKNLYNEVYIPGEQTNLTPGAIIAALQKARDIIITDHDGLFVSLLDSLVNKVRVFGLYFATLDIRQNSSIHTAVLEKVLPAGYSSLEEIEKINWLLHARPLNADEAFADEMTEETIKSIRGIKNIQSQNGEAGCHRYIISHCRSLLNVMEVYGLFLLSGWEKDDMPVDIVPLFETIDDLQHAAGVMKSLYTNEVYRQHLSKRNNRQTIMLGFSDGSKDGGYLMGNWSIYKAKEELTAISKEYRY